jgi:hypothetical protein
MGRNRKHGSEARFVPAVKAALICVLLGGSAIGYVYQKNQIIELGRQIQSREHKLKVVQQDNAQQEKTLYAAQTGYALEQRVRKLNLGLVQPSQSQIMTIIELPAYLDRSIGPIAGLK